jgi:hypothetical protein
MKKYLIIGALLGVAVINQLNAQNYQPPRPPQMGFSGSQVSLNVSTAGAVEAFSYLENAGITVPVHVTVTNLSAFVLTQQTNLTYKAIVQLIPNGDTSVTAEQLVISQAVMDGLFAALKSGGATPSFATLTTTNVYRLAGQRQGENFRGVALVK